MKRIAPLFAWVFAVAIVYYWFRFTGLPPDDHWITLGVLAVGTALTIVMLFGTKEWRIEGLGLLSLILGVVGLMRLFAAPRFDWMPSFQSWELDLVRALLVVAVLLLIPSVIRWLRVQDGSGGPPKRGILLRRVWPKQ